MYAGGLRAGSFLVEGRMVRALHCSLICIACKALTGAAPTRSLTVVERQGRRCVHALVKGCGLERVKRKLMEGVLKTLWAQPPYYPRAQTIVR